MFRFNSENFMNILMALFEKKKKTFVENIAL